jgi:hypothetical protein
LPPAQGPKQTLASRRKQDAIKRGIVTRRD